MVDAFHCPVCSFMQKDWFSPMYGNCRNRDCGIFAFAVGNVACNGGVSKYGE